VPRLFSLILRQGLYILYKVSVVVRIPSKLYFDLWSTGNSIQGLSGDKLIAVYSILKSYRSGEIKYYSYKSKNNKTVSGLSLLRSKTVLTLSVIEKYVPVLIEMGLCFIDKNGDFVVLGGEKIKELYNSYKLVPIVVGKNLNDTATNCISVRIHAKYDEQKKMISKKQYRSEIILQGLNPRTNKEYRIGKSFYKRFGDFEILDNTVLSNQSYAVLKDDSADNKSKGHYWKNKLKKAGILKTKREFERIKKMSYSFYLGLKASGSLANSVTYVKGYLVEEKISSFTPINIIKENIPLVEEKEVLIIDNKKQPYKPSFDFLSWWEKQPLQ
jgi:hypothetical protein